MRTCPRFRLFLVLALLCLLLPCVSAWGFSGWTTTPSGAEFSPGTDIVADYKISFDSWMTGTTFDADNSLTMYTDLESPRWTVTKTEEMDGQEPIIEEIPVRQTAQAKVDGWTLSYVRKQFYLTVHLTGKIPSRNVTSSVYLLKLQEMQPGAKAVAGTLIKKEVQVIVPTPEPAVPPIELVTVNMTPSEYIEITPEPAREPAAGKVITADATATASPATKTTYTPGPGPALVVLLLALLVLVVRTGRDR